MHGQLTAGIDLDVGCGSLPQVRFDDLYTAVYALIDDAKATNQLVKLHKGSHPSPRPHDVVTDFGAWFFRHRRGLFGYAGHQIGARADRGGVEHLTEFDKANRPRIAIRAAFEVLAGTQRRRGETAEQYLQYLVNRRHHLGAYRGGSSGYDDEARAFACAHFRQVGIPTGLNDVLTSPVGLREHYWPAVPR